MKCGALLKKRRKLHSPLLPRKGSRGCLHIFGIQKKDSIFHLLCRRQMEWFYMQWVLLIALEACSLPNIKKKNYNYFWRQQAKSYRHTKSFSTRLHKPRNQKENKNKPKDCWNNKQNSSGEYSKRWNFNYTNWWILFQVKRNNFLLYEKSKKFCKKKVVHWAKTGNFQHTA